MSATARRGASAGAALIALAVELALLAAWQRTGYWNFSDGAYALTARELLGGAELYRDVAAAQPPPVYLAGTALLWLHDGLGPLRAGMAFADLATAALAGLCVWRLTARRAPAIAAALACPLLPVTLHEHALLTPETLAAPLLLAGALLCARTRRAALGGALCALAVACKLAFGLPAVAIVLASRAPKRALGALAGALLVLALAGFAIFGGALWRETVRAQVDVGSAGVRYAAGLVSQGLWNELPLLVGVGAALRWGARASRDPALLRTLLAAALGGMLLLASLFKHGSYVNVLAVAEPALLALAVSGAVWAWERGGVRIALLAAGVLLAAQSASLLLSPGDAALARRPFARSGLRRALSPRAVERALAIARRCPPGVAYSGGPYLAFLARRRMPGAQPDTFIVRYAAADARFRRRAEADLPRCP